jgi:ATP-dependent DNA helicase RecG
VPDLAEILGRLHGGAEASSLESSTLEFKQESDSLKRTLEVVADAVVCLANAEGGQVVLGVSDRVLETGSVLGVSSGLSVDVLVQGVFERTRPSLSVPVEEVVHDGRRLLIVTVPRGATFYANAKGTATRRVGTQCQPFPPEQQRQALASRGLYDWSSEVCDGEESSVSVEELARLRRLLISAGKDEVAALDDSRLLRDLRLVTPAGGLTRAGLLLVGREEAIRAIVPAYGYAYQYRPSPGSEATAHLREARPMLAGIERLLDAVEARSTVHPINIAGGVQLRLHDYPARAIRELVVNAMVHRDYETEGAVEIEHSPERLVISSPGGLVFGVTPQNILTHPSTPRNRLLLEIVTGLQVAERTGQGVDRVYREMLRAGKAPPAFHDDEVRVEVTLAGGTGNESFTRFVSTELSPALAADLEVLLALDHLRYHRTLRAEDLAPRIQRSPHEAQATLERMAHAGLLETSRRTARRPFPTYSLAPSTLSGLGRSVTYHRRSADGIDQKIIEHVREYGFITNQTLRRLFDVGLYPARDLLRDLQARGILSKLDDKTAGPGVRYGPGPNFPGRRRRTLGSAGEP